MESTIKLAKTVKLNEPILVEGLPGIGYVANIASLHLIKELKAEKIGEIVSPQFQDLAITAADGMVNTPVNELYYYISPLGLHDLVFLYGNTQALYIQGQYELCETVISYAQKIGCKLIITIGGIQKNKISTPPRLYCTATDLETLSQVRGYGLDIIQGNIYGVAGLLLGLAELRGIKGFCILAETNGTYPDSAAAKAVLELLNKFIGLEVNLEGLEKVAVETSSLLTSFRRNEPKRREEFFGSV